MSISTACWARGCSIPTTDFICAVSLNIKTSNILMYSDLLSCDSLIHWCFNLPPQLLFIVIVARIGEWHCECARGGPSMRQRRWVSITFTFHLYNSIHPSLTPCVCLFNSRLYSNINTTNKIIATIMQSSIITTSPLHYSLSFSRVHHERIDGMALHGHRTALLLFVDTRQGRLLQTGRRRT